MAKTEVLPLRMTRQRIDLLTAIERLRKEKGYAPTVRELQTAIGSNSLSTTHWHLEKMREVGYVKWEPQVARTLRITSKGKAALASSSLL